MLREIILLLLICSFCQNNLASNAEILAEKPEKSNWKIEYTTDRKYAPSDVVFYGEELKEHYLEEFEGKPILLVFWATWCAPCVQEIFELDLLKKDFRKLNFEIIPVSQDFQGIKVIKEFYNKNNIRHLPIFHDYQNALFRALGVVGLPTSYIINSEGQIEAIITGNPNWNDDSLRQILLKFIPGNPVLPKNSFKDNSLNLPMKHLENNNETKPEKSETSNENEEKVKNDNKVSKAKSSETKQQETNISKKK